MSTPLELHLEHQLADGTEFFWQRLRFDAVARELGGAASVVDVGAGTGVLGERLASEYPELTYGFVEPIPALERRLEERFGAQANLREEAAFDADVACVLDVAEHQADDRAFLAELVAKLRPGAKLVVTVPALPVLWSRWDELLGHHRRYTRRTLRQAVVGLPVVEQRVEYLFPEMVLPGLVRKAVSRVRRGQGSDARGAEFPELPRWVESVLYAVGRSTQRFHRWPAGTSVLGVWVRR